MIIQSGKYEQEKDYLFSGLHSQECGDSLCFLPSMVPGMTVGGWQGGEGERTG